ncbi:MAG: RGCVC family protein [Sporichthyaceae bacterium]|jgi:hypothetical protein
MGAGQIVECQFCLQRMGDAEGWMVWPRPNGGALEFLCPSCRERPEAPCVCGHPLGTHDAVSTRHCAATAAAGLERTCACPSDRVERARSYDWR